MVNNISFPALGLDLKVSPVAFTIFNKEIYWYALIILCGFLAGLILASAGCEKRGIKKDNVFDIALFGIVSGILGARIYYVIFSWHEFAGDFWSVFRLWEGGLAIYGGVIAAIISTTIYCRVKRINLFNALDVGAVGLLLGQSIGRWGNFTNCEVYGMTTSSVFGMSINGGAPVTPLFFYESMWSLAGVILILLLRGRKTKNGQVVCFYLFWYSLGRLFLEGMRDTTYILYLIPNKLGISQAVAAALIIISALLFIYVTKSKRECFKPLPPIGPAAEKAGDATSSAA